MSVLIKGISMPKGCIDCPFMVYRENDDCILQSAEVNSRIESWDDMKSGCPLINVSAHGGLIDQDACRDDFANAEYAILSGDATKDRANSIIDEFDLLPVFIEAEEDEK